MYIGVLLLKSFNYLRYLLARVGLFNFFRPTTRIVEPIDFNSHCDIVEIQWHCTMAAARV